MVHVVPFFLVYPYLYLRNVFDPLLQQSTLQTEIAVAPRLIEIGPISLTQKKNPEQNKLFLRCVRVQEFWPREPHDAPCRSLAEGALPEGALALAP